MHDLGSEEPDALTAANARAEAAERRVGELSEALSQFDPDGEGPSNGALDEAMVAGLGASRFNAEVRAERAESEAAALRAEVERLLEEKRLNDTDLANWRLADARLDAANVLLEYSRSGEGPWQSDEEYYRARDIHLTTCAAPAKGGDK